MIPYRNNGYTTEEGSMINNGVPAMSFGGVRRKRHLERRKVPVCRASATPGQGEGCQNPVPSRRCEVVLVQKSAESIPSLDLPTQDRL